MQRPLEGLKFACVDEDVTALYSTSLFRSVLVAVLDGRELAPHRRRFEQLLEESPPQAADRLRHLASMQAVADLLGEPFAGRVDTPLIDESLTRTHGRSFLWQSFIDLAIAVQLRSGGNAVATVLTEQRLKAPVDEGDLAMTHLLHAAATPSDDVQTRPESGYLATAAALWQAGTSGLAIVLTLAARPHSEPLGPWLAARARTFDAAAAHITCTPAQWRYDRQSASLHLSVAIEGSGSLHECAAWALQDLVYLLPWHLDQLANKAVPLAEIIGARARGEVTRAVDDGKIRFVARLRGVSLSDEDRAALVGRQEAGLAWVRDRHDALRGLKAAIHLEPN